MITYITLYDINYLIQIINNYDYITLGFEILLISGIILLAGKAVKETLDVVSKVTGTAAAVTFLNDAYKNSGGGSSNNDDNDDKDKNKKSNENSTNSNNETQK